MKSWVVRCIDLPRSIDEIMEETRRKLGLTRSRFIVIAVTEYLRSLSVLSDVVKRHNGNRAL